MEKDDSPKFSSFKKNRPPKDLTFDYKEIDTLQRFISEDGKIVPSRISRLNATQQRQLTAAIKRARHLALMPVASNHTVR